ncbi:MAG: DUF1592 domain-containing protein [Planctomycetales bacterium]|nr:DUF1592 domain-containing protein [Planctomycetales bacterium]
MIQNRMLSLLIAFLIAHAACLPHTAQGDVPPAIALILQQRCQRCHGPERQRGDVRLDLLSTDFADARSMETWHEALNVLNRGEMPPQGEPLELAERRELTAWLQSLLKQYREHGAGENAAGGKTVLRRLNRFEYQNTMRDLLGIDHDYSADLPPDERGADGFTNQGAALRISDLQLEHYLRAARRGLRHAIVEGPAPEVHRHQAVESVSDKGKGNWTNELGRDGVFVARVPKFPGEGQFTLRVVARRLGDERDDLPGAYPRMRVRLGYRADTQTPSRVVGESDVSSTSPQTFEFRGRLEEFPIQSRTQSKYPGMLIWIDNVYRAPATTATSKSAQTSPRQPLLLQAAPGPAQAQPQSPQQEPQAPSPRKNKNKNKQKDKAGKKAKRPAKATPAEGPVIIIESIEFTAPVFAQWPPAHHKQLLPQHSDDEVADAAAALRAFLPRAFRRPVSEATVETMVGLFQALRSTSPSFEAAMRETFAAALISPQFLYLVEPQSEQTATPSGNTKAGAPKLGSYEVASRISYLLWSTMPDAALLEQAATGQLDTPEQRRSAALRMLEDPRSAAFINEFSRQWLDLDRVDRVAINPSVYPNFDLALKDQMRRESQAYFGQVLRENVGIAALLDSDFAMWNRDLALHYGLPADQAPPGREFQRIELPSGPRRGGLLTHGSTLLGNSTGEDSHPVKRAVWILDRLLNDPPAPPPPNVPNLDDTRDISRLSVKQRLQAHLENEACADCHRGIDPWGVPLEEFDAVGLWRSEQRAPGQRAGKSSPVEIDSVLPDGAKISGVVELQQYLVEQRLRQFTESLTTRLLEYALGRAATAADGPAIRLIVDKLTAPAPSTPSSSLRPSPGLRDLVLAVIASPEFTRP